MPPSSNSKIPYGPYKQSVKAIAANMCAGVHVEPEGKYKLHITLYVSNLYYLWLYDVDNRIKALVDAVAAAFGFNDNRIFSLSIEKQLSPRRNDYAFITLDYYK